MNDLVKTWSVFKRLSMNDKDMQSAFERACRKTNDVIEVLEERDSLQQENDELRACIESLKQNAYIIMNYDEYYEEEALRACEAIDQTPKQSLAKIKAEAIREMLDEVWRSDVERVDIEDYATNLEQDNE